MSFCKIQSLINDRLVTTIKPVSYLLCYKIHLVRLFYITLEMPFYAVAIGRTPGVYKSWQECLIQTTGYPKAKYRKFNTESEALNFVNSIQPSNEMATPAVPIKIENIRPPEMKFVNNYSSTLLKQDKLGLVANKLDNFIETTNKTLKEFGERLELLESSAFFKNTSESKRKQDLKSEEIISSNECKKKRSECGTETNIPMPNKAVEEVDNSFNKNLSKDGFIVDGDGYVIVYTDGACSNNGRQGAKAGLGVWFNHSNPFNVAAPVEGTATNNNAEIQAVTRAIYQATLAGIRKLNVHTDSQFMINCMTDWIKKWKKNNWITASGGPVKNKDQLILLDKAIQSVLAVKWTHVRGHMGNEGNERADELARNGAAMY